MGYNDFEGFEDEDDRGAQQGPKALRDALKAAQKRVAELEEANGKLEVQVSTRNLGDVLTKKDLPQGLGRFMLQDKVDPSDELAVNKWLHDNQSVFGFELKTEGQGGGSGAAGSDGANEHEELAAAQARIQGASNGHAGQPLCTGRRPDPGRDRHGEDPGSSGRGDRKRPLSPPRG